VPLVVDTIYEILVLPQGSMETSVFWKSKLLCALLSLISNTEKYEAYQIIQFNWQCLRRKVISKLSFFFSPGHWVDRLDLLLCQTDGNAFMFMVIFRRKFPRLPYHDLWSPDGATPDVRGKRPNFDDVLVASELVVTLVCVIAIRI
jgi:hypothetical protein